MAARTQVVTVSDKQELENAVQRYIAQGYAVYRQTKDSTTLFKKNEFKPVWAVVGLLLCLVPLLIYLLIYATSKDQMVIIRIVGSTEGDVPE